MQGVDHREKLNEFVLDPRRKITKAHRDAVCKQSMGKETCRYIGLAANGFFCAKHTPMRAVLDQNVSEDKMKAQGDNCEGIGPQPEEEKHGKEKS
jgi:hypothetical protein